MAIWQLVASTEICLSLRVVGYGMSEVTDTKTGNRFTGDDPARAISEAVAKATGWEEPTPGTEG
jgi:hypothetical protein